jgi:hypothetical protein
VVRRYVRLLDPGVLLLRPGLNDAGYILGAGADTRTEFGAFLEILTAMAGIATAVVLFPILRRVNEAVALGYVAGGIVESTIIEWTRILGPQFCAGFGNGILLGYLMYKSGLVPPRMAWLGLVGGPLAFVGGIAVLFGVLEAGVQGCSSSRPWRSSGRPR